MGEPPRRPPSQQETKEGEESQPSQPSQQEEKEREESKEKRGESSRAVSAAPRIVMACLAAWAITNAEAHPRVKPVRVTSRVRGKHVMPMMLITAHMLEPTAATGWRVPRPAAASSGQSGEAGQDGGASGERSTKIARNSTDQDKGKYHGKKDDDEDKKKGRRGGRRRTAAKERKITTKDNGLKERVVGISKMLTKPPRERGRYGAH